MPTQDKKIAPKAHRPALIAGVVVIIVLLAAPFGYLAAMSGRVMPGVAVNGLAVGGLTKNEAGAKLEVAVAAFETELNFTNGKRSVKIDTGRKMIALDSDAGLAAAYGVGRSGSIIDRLGQAGFQPHQPGMGERLRRSAPEPAGGRPLRGMSRA